MTAIYKTFCISVPILHSHIISIQFVLKFFPKGSAENLGQYIWYKTFILWNEI